MNRLLPALVLAVGCAAVVSAQTQTTEVKSKTKIEVKDGKDVTLTGCVERIANSDGFLLSKIGGSPDPNASYQLVFGSDDLAKHVGHTVEIKGKAADVEGGKVKTETKTETKVNGGDTQEQKVKGEVTGGAQLYRYLGVKSLRMISESCP